MPKIVKRLIKINRLDVSRLRTTTLTTRTRTHLSDGRVYALSYRWPCTALECRWWPTLLQWRGEPKQQGEGRRLVQRSQYGQSYEKA
jgi:hypothetical protein